MQETLGIKPNGNGTDKEMLTLILENNKLQMTQVMTQMSSTMTDAIKGMTAVVEKLTVKTEDPAVAELKKANQDSDETA